jgi:hypothetical protein
MNDIDHPKHYTFLTDIQCIQVTEHFNFNRGNAIKYIWRAGNKDKKKEVEDLQKAIWYLQREIDNLK